MSASIALAAAGARTHARHPGQLAFLDAMIGARFPAHDGDELRRARFVVGANLLLGAAALFFVGVNRVLGWDPSFIPVTLGTAVFFAANIWVLRRTGRLDLAALCLCLVVLAAAIASSWVQGGLSSIGLIWALAICGPAGLIMAPRLGFLCVALTLVQLGSLYAAERMGHVFPASLPEPTVMFINQIAATLVVAVLAWVYDRSRRDALSARDAALATLEESQEARVALVENIAAVIYSVDADLRLIAGNSRFKALSARRGEPPIEPGQPVLDGLAPRQHDELRAMFERALAGEHLTVERRLELRSGTVECEVSFNPIRRASGEVRGVTVLGRDISERKQAQADLALANRDLARAAHLAGKAEVATDVLHNVGNVLTGIDSRASIVLEHLDGSKLPFLTKTVALLPEAPEALAAYLTTDEQGRRVCEYLRMLAPRLEIERGEMTSEMRVLRRQLDHMKAVIARQQAYARPDGLVERVVLDDLIDQALEPNAPVFRRDGIEVVKQIATSSTLSLDRHKLLEILGNLLANSVESLEASARPAKQIVVRAGINAEGKLQIEVSDNGQGIVREDLPRLFSYGFTTKPHGHGFGLAGSLLCARTMAGTLRGHSDGVGKGATFTIELPCDPAATPSAQERAS